MYYCPECNTIFDITKFINIQKGGKTITNEHIISTVLNGDNLDKNDIKGIDIEQFTKSPDYKKLSPQNKTYVLNRIMDMMPKNKEPTDEKDIDRSYFVCNNCGFYKIIKDKTLIYSKHKDSGTYSSSIQNVSEYRYNPILLRTRSYKCPLKECLSHTKIEHREATIHRTGQGYNIMYVCVSCGTSWNI